LYIEEYSPDLQYIKGTHNVVADALSRLDKLDTPMEDMQESFLGLLECFGAKKTKELHFHPLNFKYLLKMQESDKSIMKILEKDSEKYTLQDFHGGGKTTSLICHKNKIVVPVGPMNYRRAEGRRQSRIVEKTIDVERDDLWRFVMNNDLISLSIDNQLY
jgi:hypothetical protein